MQLLWQGAEAKLYITKYLGKKCVKKVRARKNYREEKLDTKILKERLRTECMLLHRAKIAGIKTPHIWKIVPEEFSFYMEFIAGNTMKKELKKKNAESLCGRAGQVIGKLHANGIIHGDLTTGNFLASKEGLVLVDFGLGGISSKLEDRTVDLLNFRKTFMATHFDISKNWQKIEKGYLNEYAAGEQVLRHISNIERRARYA